MIDVVADLWEWLGRNPFTAGMILIIATAVIVGLIALFIQEREL